MVLFGRCRRRADEDCDAETNDTPDKGSAEESVSSGESTEANIVDETEMMLQVVLKLREDPEFAKNMYANCPRLQHLLNRHPGLRPIFEDPKLVCLNFEKVYTSRGGILPEDLEKYKPNCFQRTKAAFMKRLVIITRSKYFKIFKCLLLVKKCLGLLSPMKAIGCAKGCLQSMCCSCLEDSDELLDGDGDGNQSEAKQKLNDAADYMEDPDVQEEMNRMMENPESMEDAIEQNENLKGLRETNPVCAELMSDPDTMKCLTDPDNLRALGDAPDMIEADFADSGFEPPDTEVDYGGETDAPEIDGDMDDLEAREPNFEPQEKQLPDIQEVDESAFEDLEEPEIEPEPQEEFGADEEEGIEGPAAEDFEDVEYDERQGGSSSRARGRQQQKKQANQNSKGGRFGGVTDAAVGWLGGAVLGELVGDFSLGGGEEEMEIAEDAALVGAVGASMATAGDEMDAIDDFAETAQDQMENAEEVADQADDDRDRDRRSAAVGAGAGVGVATTDDRKKSGTEEEEEEDDGPKGFRGFMGSAASALKDAAKETVMAAVIGEDATEFIVDDLEREEEEEDSENEADDKKKQRKKKKNRTDDRIPATSEAGDNFSNALDS